MQKYVSNVYRSTPCLCAPRYKTNDQLGRRNNFVLSVQTNFVLIIGSLLSIVRNTMLRMGGIYYFLAATHVTYLSGIGEMAFGVVSWIRASFIGAL